MAKAKYEEWQTEEGLLKLEAWARNGLIDVQIAHNMGISVKTLYEWKNKYSNISDALKKGKEVVDIEVENALLNNAKGFTYIDRVVSTKKEVIYQDGKRVKEISEPVIVEVEKYKQPETTAQIFWLKNRKPAEWRDKQQLEHSGNVDTGVNKLGSILEQLKEK